MPFSACLAFDNLLKQKMTWPCRDSRTTACIRWNWPFKVRNLPPKFHKWAEVCWLMLTCHHCHWHCQQLRFMQDVVSCDPRSSLTKKWAAEKCDKCIETSLIQSRTEERHRSWSLSEWVMSCHSKLLSQLLRNCSMKSELEGGIGLSGWIIAPLNDFSLLRWPMETLLQIQD